MSTTEEVEQLAVKELEVQAAFEEEEAVGAEERLTGGGGACRCSGRGEGGGKLRGGGGAPRLHRLGGGDGVDQGEIFNRIQAKTNPTLTLYTLILPICPASPHSRW